MPALAFPTGAATGTPIAIGTSDTTLHTTRAGKKSEVSILVFNNDAAADYNVTLKIGGTAIGVTKIEKLAGPYLVLPPIVLDAGLAITATTTIATKLCALVQVAEYD
ncbi:MAG: hypothetical protein ACT7A5_15090 [Ferrovibrionaceae bacterium]